MDDNFRKQVVFEKNRKSVGIAYVLWATLGLLGIHRFYAGKTSSGALRLLMMFIPVIGWTIALALWIIDLFIIPKMINEENMKVIIMLNHGDPEPASMEVPPPASHQPQPVPQPQLQQPKPTSEAERRRQAMLDDLRQTGYKKERRDRFPLNR